MSEQHAFIVVAKEDGQPVQLTAATRETADRIAQSFKEQGLESVEVLDGHRA